MGVTGALGCSLLAAFGAVGASAGQAWVALPYAPGPSAEPTAARASGGAAVLSVMPGVNNIQSSNFGANSFQIANTGTKRIAQVVIDVTGALYPDTVFDPEGLAGDGIAKALTLDSRGSTGVQDPLGAGRLGVPGGTRYEPAVGGPGGGALGFERLVLVFDPETDGGFEPGERLGFSIDMDPNSIAGSDKGPLDAGSVPRWDVGGVSGAELIGSVFTVTFDDGTTATGQLFSDTSRAGARALASQDTPGRAVRLSVSGIGVGADAVGVDRLDGGFKTGSFGAGGADGPGGDPRPPRILVTGAESAGHTVRVVLTRGFIQPVTAYNAAVHDQLAALARAAFPANNAVEFQVVDVELTGEPQDLTGLFSLGPVDGISFGRDPGKPFSIEPAHMPIGVVAAVIGDDGLPLGPVTPPVYLRFAGAEGERPARDSGR